MFVGAQVKADENGRLTLSPLSYPEKVKDMSIMEYEQERQPQKLTEMTAIIRETGETVQGTPWDDGRFHAEDGTARSGWQHEVEIIET